MPRDVHNFTVPIKRDLYLNGSLIGASTTNQQSLRSTRSDSTPTDPWPNGTYHYVTGYDAFFSKVSYRPFVVKWNTSYGNKYVYQGDGPETPTYIWRAGCSSSLLPNPSNYIVNRVRSAIDSQVRDDLDISQFAGEARETARLGASILIKLLKIVRAVRRLRKGQGSRDWYNETIREARASARPGSASRSAANAYLAYMYGVRPLISDMRKIAEHWDSRCEAPISKPLYAREEEKITFFPSSTRTVTERKNIRGVASGAYAFVTNPQLLRASQYGLTSPLSLAWELTTLSFVVDWFTGFGSFIQALEPPLGVSIRDYWETQFVDVNIDWKIDYYKEKGSPPTLDGPNQLAEATVLVKAMARTNPTRLLPPPPYLNLGVSSSQVTSLLALIRGRI